MRIPVGAVSQASEVGARKTIQLLPGKGDRLVDDKAWLINISTTESSNPKTSIADSLDSIVAALEGAFGVKGSDGRIVHTDVELIDRVDQLSIGGQRAGRVYLRVPGRDGTKIVKGYTVFNPVSKQFLLLELITPNDALDRTRGTYETIVATAAFRASEEVNRERELAVATTTQILAALKPEDYLDAMGCQRGNGSISDFTWQRLYVPAKSGDDLQAKELGYRGIQFWRGQRGEINPDLPKNRWTDVERQEGYLARLQVRLIDESSMGVQVGNKPPAAVFVDSIGLYFMTPDRAQEALSIRLVKRDAAGNELARWTETAARAGNEVTLVVGDPTERTRPIVAPFRPDGYLCQFETFLLPTILVKHAMQETQNEYEAGTYSYRSDGESVSFRRDIVSRDADTRGWTIATRIRDEPVSQTYVYDARGNHVRTELTEGRVWEPIEIGRLFDLWQKKRLPTEAAGGAKRKR
ncbi:MAG: hypothetical protein AB7G11_07565 [Phycisphaerales bacterium]